MDLLIISLLDIAFSHTMYVYYYKYLTSIVSFVHIHVPYKYRLMILKIWSKCDFKNVY